MDTRIAALVVFGAMAIAQAARPQDELAAPRRLRASELKLPIPQAALDRQFAALSAMPAVKVEYSPFGNVLMLDGPTRLFISAQGRVTQRDQSADEIVRKLRPLLLASGTEKLIVKIALPSDDGTRLFLKLRQTIRDLPVEGSHIALEIDTLTGEIIGGSFHFVPDRGLATEPKVTRQDATRAAIEMLEASGVAPKGKVTADPQPVLKYFRGYRPETLPALTWQVAVTLPPTRKDDGFYTVMVDAVTGAVLDVWSATKSARRWSDEVTK